MPWQNLLVLTQKCKKVTLSLVGYFIIRGPLVGLKSVPGDFYGPAESIDTFFLWILFVGPNFFILLG